MKNLIPHIFLVPLLFCSTLNGQVIYSKAEGPADKSTELPTVSIVAANVPVAYIVDNISKREKEFALKPTFDAANQYDSLFTKSAGGSLNKKSETGIVKLMNDNNSTPMVYYNNACTGTILKLTNPENGNIIYVVVVGKIAPAENSYLLKISDMVARKLSIKNDNSVELVCYVE